MEQDTFYASLMLSNLSKASDIQETNLYSYIFIFCTNILTSSRDLIFLYADKLIIS